MDVVEMRGAEEAEHLRGTLNAPVQPYEQLCYSTPGHAVHRAFGGVVGKAYPAIGEGGGVAFPFVLRYAIALKTAS